MAFAQTSDRSSLVADRPMDGGFVLAADGAAPTIVYDARDARVVAHAAADLAADLKAVAGASAQVTTKLEGGGKRLVIIGALGQNRWIDQLVSNGRLDVTALRGGWETFLIAVVEKPAPGFDQALIIVGSDRRGAAFGVYELSEAMGVSPWSWWADVTPPKRPNLYVAAGERRFGPPSVRYRGLFINDEDWGLFPWASRTFDPSRGNFGPKSYERVFELLLRLKANTLWPAMHKTSAAFNADPANARLADDYAIVMGSSHAEPMLRNNVGEWNGKAADFNYAANSKGVAAYWESRVKSNAAYESLWTLGMRGIHDSGIVGANSTKDRIKLLDTIIADQRAMLRKYVSPDLSKARQMFVPYKEVLELYRNGLDIPDDVTIVWPDDNFGYIRQFPNDAERARSGGAGVYYHLSYLGAPLAYLWLSTTPPALVQEEMTRAYDLGARTIWIANVGDIKPAEIGTSHFLEMAWDIDRWRGKTQRAYLDDWASRTFGADHGAEIGAILDEHFSLNFERRPEHLQWPAQGEHRLASAFSPAEVDTRLKRFSRLTTASDQARKSIPPALSDAYFELVDYPVQAAAAANLRYFAAERYAELIDTQPAQARAAGGAAVAADQTIKALTQRFNQDIAGGKWRWIMAEEPADGQWKIFRTNPVALPGPGLYADPSPFLRAIAQAQPPALGQVIEAETLAFDSQWRTVQGLGRGAGALVAKAPGAQLRFRVTVPPGAVRTLDLALLPLFPDEGEIPLRIDVSIDGGVAVQTVIERRAGSRDWSQGVLDNLLKVTASPPLAPGDHHITLTARSSGVALDRLILSAASTSQHRE